MDRSTTESSSVRHNIKVSVHHWSLFSLKKILITWDLQFSLNIWIIIALIAVIKTLHASGKVIKLINYKCLNSYNLVYLLCNDYVISVLISIDESGIFNVNVYIEMKTV